MEAHEITFHEITMEDKRWMDEKFAEEGKMPVSIRLPIILFGARGTGSPWRKSAAASLCAP